MGLRRELFGISISMSAVPSGGAITASESSPGLRLSQLRSAVQPSGQTDAGAWTWGRAFRTHLWRDNCILTAPGTHESHHTIRPPLQPRLRLWLWLQSLDPAEDWWDFCIQMAQTHENTSSSKGLQDLWKFHSWFFGSQLGNYGLNLQRVRGWSVLPKLHITALSKAAGPDQQVGGKNTAQGGRHQLIQVILELWITMIHFLQNWPQLCIDLNFSVTTAIPLGNKDSTRVRAFQEGDVISQHDRSRVSSAPQNAQ